MRDFVLAENIRLGTRGWQHPNWQGSFYPDDLPEDWQLTYYSNEFDCVLVPSGYWNAHTLEQAFDWCDQVNPAFRFYVEPPAALDSDAAAGFARQLETMSDCLAAVLCPDNPGEELLQSLHDGRASSRLLSAHSVWTPEQPRTSPLALLPRAWSDLRELRGWLEAFAPVHDAGKQAVLCSMPHPDINALQQARTLMQIMGL